jgi:hypothetical protein
VPHHILNIVFNVPLSLDILLLTFDIVILFPLDLSKSTVVQVWSVGATGFTIA